jgi:hypothetical protein
MRAPGPFLVDATTWGQHPNHDGSSANGARSATSGLVAFDGSLTAIVKRTFTIDPGGLTPSVQGELPLAGADVHTADPRRTSPRYESDFVPFKARADALCVGSAHAAGGHPAPHCVVAFGVGGWLKQILVTGNRTWKLGIARLGNTPTDPEPFVTMPVSFENAYGGRDPADATGVRAFAQNPIGKGYTTSSAMLAGLPLPNLEDPENRIRSWKDQPAPRGFGPVGRTWQPRFARVGTYDERWLEPGAPAVPDDFDEGYYNCAPEDQQIEGYLRGDEKVRVVNMHPVHTDLTFRLPKLRVRCLADRERAGRRQLEDVPTHLDTLWVDMEALLVVLVWRARLDHQATAGLSHLLVVSEPLGTAPAPPEAHRRHLDAFEAGEAEPEDEEPVLEPVEEPRG